MATRVQTIHCLHGMVEFCSRSGHGAVQAFPNMISRGELVGVTALGSLDCAGSGRAASRADISDPLR